MSRKLGNAIPRQKETLAREFYRANGWGKPDRPAIKSLLDYCRSLKDPPEYGTWRVVNRPLFGRSGSRIIPQLVRFHEQWSGYADPHGEPLYLPILDQLAIREIAYDVGIRLLDAGGTQVQCVGCNNECQIVDRFGLPRLSCRECNGSAILESKNRELADTAAGRFLRQLLLATVASAPIYEKGAVE